MIIDVHGHLVPSDLLAAIRKERARFPSLRLIEDGGSLALAFAGGKPSRPIMKGLSDVAGRLAWMGKQGIDRQVVGSWPDWFGYELPAAEGEAWCRLINDAQARRRQGRAAFRAARGRAAAGRRPRRRRAQGRRRGGLPRRDDRHLAARHRQRARRRRPRSVLGGGGRDRRRHPHPSELRCRRCARERLRPRQRRRPHQRRHRRGGAAALQRACHALPQCQDFRSHGRRRPALPARAAAAQCQDHAGARRSGGGACSASIPTASCTTRGCCDLSSRCSAPTV